MKPISFLIIFQLVLFQATAQLNEKSVFFANKAANVNWLTYKDNHQALYRIITNEAFRLLDERAENISKLHTAADWKTHQEKVHEALCLSLDKFTKTPLNAKTTGILERENFTVEKVMFESQPGFYVTAGLFLPKHRQKPAPAVIYCCGHTELGFRSETYQRVILNLVEKGFIVLAFDPLGQGERLQYADTEKGTSKVGGSTSEHSYAGVQTLLTGTSLTDYFIWDGIRVVDYLETRPEVDMTRIGITGRSGGGTQTALIAACEKRIYAAAPENYITSFRRLLQSIGPQDAEQNPWQAIAKGIDHADFLHSHAPKPALILTTTHDFFSIQGARETYNEVKRSYEAFGKPMNLQMVEDAGQHQSTQKNRETLYAFFQKHLNVPGDSGDKDIEPFTVEELWVTPTGQINSSFTGETVFSINKKLYNNNNNLSAHSKTPDLSLFGIDCSRKLTAAVYTGKFEANQMLVEKYFLENNRSDYALPVYVIKNPENNSKKIIIWFHSKGKNALLDEPLVKPVLDQGYSIVIADLPGTGELHDPEFTGDGVIDGIPFNYTFGANLVGKSIPGIQAEAIDLLMQFTDKMNHLSNNKKLILAQGTSASSLLLYASDKRNIEKVYFYNLPEAPETLVEQEFYNPEVAFSVAPGSLPDYDQLKLIDQLSANGVKVAINKQATGKDTDITMSINEVKDFFEK